jgi:hypothetical protein
MAELALDSLSHPYTPQGDSNLSWTQAHAGSYGKRHVIADISTTLPEALIGCMPDPLGCGKTSYATGFLWPDDVIHDNDSLMRAEAGNKAFYGVEFLFTLKLPSGRRALSLVPSHHNHAIGERIGIKLEVDQVVAFRRE